MSKSFRRYELLLPLKFNDGRPVPDELIGATLIELRTRFGAISVETQTIHGTWSYLGQEYRDDLMRVFLDVQDDQEANQFFLQFKDELKQRFQQLDIWITSYPIDVI
jgi:hypothetical protein